MKNQRNSILSLGLLATTMVISAVTIGQSKTYDFKDPKGVNGVSLTLESSLEPIFGFAKGVTGSIKFDPKNPNAATGVITMDASNVQFTSDGYSSAAQNNALEKTKFPTMQLKLVKVLKWKKKGSNFAGTIEADFVCKGITSRKKFDITAAHLIGKGAERTNGKVPGDLLVVRGKFNISRKEHKMIPELPESIVGDVIEVGISVVGTSK